MTLGDKRLSQRASSSRACIGLVFKGLGLSVPPSVAGGGSSDPHAVRTAALTTSPAASQPQDVGPAGIVTCTL